MTILILYLSLESIFQIKSGRKFFGAILLGFAINIKLLPIVLLPYLMYRNEWKAAIATCVVLVVAYASPALWIGITQNHFLMMEYANLVNPALQRHLLDVEETSFHSLTTLIATLFIEDIPEKYALNTKRNIANVSIEQLQVIILCVRVFFVGLTLWFLRSKPFVSFGSNQKTWWELSYLLLAVPLIFPHQQHYAFLMSLPAVAWVIFWYSDEYYANRKNPVLFTSLLVIYCLYNASLLLGVFNAWYNHYKILTYAAIGLVALLAFTKPRVYRNGVA